MCDVNFDLLRKTRQDKRLTIEELAFLAELNVSLVSRYDRGKVKRPTVLVVRALECALGLGKGSLIG